MTLSRRHLIGAAATGVAFAGFSRFAEAQTIDPAAPAYASEVTGYGPLRADPAQVFDLPEGFAYTIVQKAGDVMSDGLVAPHKMDGMGCFALGGGKVALVRNQELKATDLEIGPFGKGDALRARMDTARGYDRNQDGRVLSGGTTTLVYDLKARRLERSHLSLAGTSTNCAGGITPWGSWLTCEEVVRSPGAHTDGQTLGQSHGWVFEVPSRHRGLVEAAPLTGLGRFKHEAACVDPRTGVVYLTEDENESLFYRFLPNDRRNLAKGGRLQALGFNDGSDSRNWTEVEWGPGQWREVRWYDLDGVDNPHGDLGRRGHEKGCAWFARGEGLTWGPDGIYFTCTVGGPRRLGQIMRYRPSRHEGAAGEKDAPGALQLFLEASDKRLMNMCDNLTVAPWGHLIVCEDKVEPRGTNYLRGVTPDGKVYTLGGLVRPDATVLMPTTELAGVCFSPDGSTLFVNAYWPGMTLAITGPWSRFRA